MENVYKVEMTGNRYYLVDPSGENRGTMGINTVTRRRAYENGQALLQTQTESGDTRYKRIDMNVFENLVSPLKVDKAVPAREVESASTVEQLREFIHTKSPSLKPEELVMSELTWKFLVRSAVRAKNIMLTGHAGTGKTMAARMLMKALDRPGFTFNLGSTQDPRSSLIGNTQFSNDKGTFFSKSAFVKAITTPNAVVLLDEFTRAHPDAWNILMPVLDESQRVLRLDEAEGSPVVKVAEGVTFIATANIGNEYTSTRVLDRAITDRFTRIEVDVLNAEQEADLLRFLFPDVELETITAISEIAHHTRINSKSDDPKVSSIISTRASVEATSLVYDGFTFVEACEIAILPFFEDDGGVDSERTYIRQLIQKYEKDTNEGSLFNEAEDDDDDVQTVNW